MTWYRRDVGGTVPYGRPHPISRISPPILYLLSHISYLSPISLKIFSKNQITPLMVSTARPGVVDQVPSVFWAMVAAGTVMAPAVEAKTPVAGV